MLSLQFFVTHRKITNRAPVTSVWLLGTQLCSRSSHEWGANTRYHKAWVKRLGGVWSHCCSRIGFPVGASQVHPSKWHPLSKRRFWCSGLWLPNIHTTPKKKIDCTYQTHIHMNIHMWHIHIYITHTLHSHPHAHTHTWIYTQVHIHTYIHHTHPTYSHTWLYTHVHIHKYTTHTISTHTYAHSHMHIYIYTSQYPTFTHAHTHSHMCRQTYDIPHTLFFICHTDYRKNAPWGSQGRSVIIAIMWIVVCHFTVMSEPSGVRCGANMNRNCTLMRELQGRSSPFPPWACAPSSLLLADCDLPRWEINAQGFQIT